MVVPNENDSTFSTSYMVKKLVLMALNLEEALKFTWEVDVSKCRACGLLKSGGRRVTLSRTVTALYGVGLAYHTLTTHPVG